MEGGLVKPGVVVDLIAPEVRLHLRQVHGQAVGRHGVHPVRLALSAGEIRPRLCQETLGQLPDVVTLIAVLREGEPVLPQGPLHGPGIDGPGKLVDLVPGVVDVELPAHLRPAGGQHGGQGIPQHAAPGVAHVHGAGGVGGDKLHHDLLALEGVGAAIVRPLVLHGGADLLIPAATQPEVQKARPGDLGGGKIASLQVHVVQQGLGDVPGRPPQGLGGRQGKGGGEVAVGGVPRDLHRGGVNFRLGQSPIRRRGPVGRHGQGRGLVLGILDHVRHIKTSFQCLL